MNTIINHLKTNVYNKIGFSLSELEMETESKEYEACRYQLNALRVISRAAKITPTKTGQFVTFWKRKENGPIEPYDEKDVFDYLVVNVQSANQMGQFVFPKNVLREKGILTTDKKEGKRAFRVYPKWDKVNSKQAEKTQNWQVAYFYEIDVAMNLQTVLKLFK